ncbi:MULTISPECIES: Flp family type IVb pilin [Nocardioides]|uniref:Flp family type IVb pilin n=1 Tax=Nocardioides vastitatis TaxID=2568655 RepID=A0ABW0ZIA9_9ACTN|nr:Flp family type IVb pilin [Nocardioides sp.]THJ12594.1 Flp family type IVb pilin [Nocardioides sp.]
MIRCDGAPHERGASAIEYALLVFLIAAVVVGGVLLLGPNVAELYETASSW